MSEAKDGMKPMQLAEEDLDRATELAEVGRRAMFDALCDQARNGNLRLDAKQAQILSVAATIACAEVLAIAEFTGGISGDGMGAQVERNLPVARKNVAALVKAEQAH